MGNPETLLVVDNGGRHYTLHFGESDPIWVLKLFDHRILVAKVNCLVEEDTLRIADLHVFEEAAIPQGYVVSCLRSALGLEPRTANYQRRGLGTKLLGLIIRHAKERNFVRITGNLFPRDLEMNPKLPMWYQRCGFTVNMDESRSAGIVEFRLC